MHKLLITGIFCAFSVLGIAAKPEQIDSAEAEKSSINQASAKVVQGKQFSGGSGVALHAGRKLSPDEMRKPPKPALVIKFNLPKGGDYNLVLLGFAQNGGSDSFYYSINGGRLFMQAVRAGKVFRLRKKVRLSDGPHTFEIYSRENGCIIDKLEILPFKGRHAGRGKLKMPDWPAPPIYPPSIRPRVLLNPEFIKTLKQRIAVLSTYKEALERIKYFAGLENGGKIGRDKMYRSIYSRAIRCQAFLYVLSGSKQDGEAALRNLLVLLKEAKFEKRQDICRSYGELIYTAGIVYDWCYPLLSDADKKAVVAGIMKWAPRMEIGWPPVRQSALTSHAGEAQLLRDLLTAGIAVYDTDPKIYDYCASRFFAEMVPAREFFYKSHRHHQGDSYGTYRFNWAVWSAVLFKRMSGKMVFLQNMGKVPYSWIYMRLPDGQTLRDGDTTRTGAFWIAPQRHLMIANLYGDPYVKYESLYQGAEEFARTSPLNYLLFNDPDVKPRPHSELPWTKFFPEPLGGMIARTGWQMGPDSPVAVVEMKGAGYQFNNHMHLDAGTFQIYYKGYLATDGGAYSGLKYGTPFDWSYNKRTIAHNGMLAYDPKEQFAKGDNDGGQRQVNNVKEPKNLQELLAKGYRNGHVLAHDFGPDKLRPYYSYLKVDLKEAYSAKKMAAYTRTFCFLNFADDNRPGALIVFDRMTCVKPEIRKIWLLQSLFKPQFKGNTITVTRADKGNSGKLVDTILLPEQNNIKLEAIGGPGKENWVFGHNYPIPRHSDLSNGWRTQLSPEKSALTDEFLNVMQIMDLKAKALPVKMINQPNILGVALNNRLVIFPKNAKVLDQTVTFTLPAADKPVQVLITGLKPGCWSVNGKFSCEVKADSGTAFFVMPGKTQVKMTPAVKSSLPLKKFNIAPPAEKLPGPRVIINNKTIPLESMFQKEGNTWIPGVIVLQAAGAKCNYVKGVLTAEYKGRKLKIKQGTHRWFINGVKIYLKMNAPEVNGEIYLPVESVASFLQMRPTLYWASRCLVLSKYPDARFKYPWYEAVRTNRHNAAHPVIDACDGDLKSYWAGRGVNSYIQVDLAQTISLKGVRIAWYKGTSRRAIFEIRTSADGKQWRTAFSGKSSGATENGETYSFTPVKARYVRIIGRGNTANDFNSIREAEVIPVK